MSASLVKWGSILLPELAIRLTVLVLTLTGVLLSVPSERQEPQLVLSIIQRLAEDPPQRVQRFRHGIPSLLQQPLRILPEGLRREPILLARSSGTAELA